MGTIKYGGVGNYKPTTLLYGQLQYPTTFLNPVADMSYLGSLYHAWTWFAGGARGTVPSVSYPLQGNAYKIIIYDRNGIKLDEISSEIQNSPLDEIEFELLTSGCGALKIKLNKATTVPIAYNYRVDVHLFGDPNPWYSGYILDIPQDGTTEVQKEYSGFGFYNQLDDCLVNRSYTMKQVSWIVRDLVSTLIEPQTDIIYDSGKIAGTSYVVNDIQWDRVSAKDVFNQLAEMVLGYEWGVDHERDFFFRPKDTTISNDSRFWAGKHLTKFVPKADISKVKNRIHVYSGKSIVGNKTGYILTLDDLTSQAAYGLKEGKETIPSVLSDTDAAQWGAYRLVALKDPVQSATVEGIQVFQNKIEAKGMARVTSLDGLYSYDLPIVKVVYNVSSEGIKVKVDLGEKNVSFTDATIALLKKVKLQEQLSDQRIQQ